jgi:MYXO-CTERM domain-containing protein
MRLHRWLVALVVAGGLAVPRAAESCQLFGPYLGTGAQLPLGCPIHVYAQLNSPTDLSPKLTVLRDGAYVDATGASNIETVTLAVDRTFAACAGSPGTTTRTFDPYQHYAIVPKSVSVGDQIGIGTGWIIGIQIAAAAPCPAPAPPTLACTEVQPCFDEPPFGDFVEEDSGCAAGGGGPAGGLVLLGLVALRRRAHRRRRR